MPSLFRRANIGVVVAERSNGKPCDVVVARDEGMPRCFGTGRWPFGRIYTRTAPFFGNDGLRGPRRSGGRAVRDSLWTLKTGWACIDAELMLGGEGTKR